MIKVPLRLVMAAVLVLAIALGVGFWVASRSSVEPIPAHEHASVVARLGAVPVPEGYRIKPCSSGVLDLCRTSSSPIAPPSRSTVAATLSKFGIRISSSALDCVTNTPPSPRIPPGVAITCSGTGSFDGYAVAASVSSQVHYVGSPATNSLLGTQVSLTVVGKRS